MEIVHEKVRHSENQSFGCFNFQGNRIECPYHVHEEVEITLILSGSGYRLVGDHFGHFRPGDLVMIGSNLPHMYQQWEDDDGPGECLYVQFSPDNLNIFNLPEFRRVRKMVEKARQGLVFSQKRRRNAEMKLQEMYRQSS